jgi:hypothetical protein
MLFLFYLVSCLVSYVQVMYRIWLAIHPSSPCASIRLAVLISCSVCLRLYTHFSVELGPVSPPPLFHSLSLSRPR